MSIALRSLLAWALAFLALELPAHYHLNRLAAGAVFLAAAAGVVALMPLVTLSSTVWDGEAWWHPLADAVVIFAAVLVVHLRYHLSASYLIFVAVAIAVATALHAATTR